MKKIIELVRVEAVHFGSVETKIQLSFVEYKPKTEEVNPIKEKFERVGQALKAKGIPSDIAALFTELDFSSLAPSTYIPMVAISTSTIVISKKEYEALGSPTIGALLLLELNHQAELT